MMPERQPAAPRPECWSCGRRPATTGGKRTAGEQVVCQECGALGIYTGVKDELREPTREEGEAAMADPVLMDEVRRGVARRLERRTGPT